MSRTEFWQQAAAQIFGGVSLGAGAALGVWQWVVAGILIWILGIVDLVTT